jgi:cytoskeletal protein CcmA (bactofilin family)
MALFKKDLDMNRLDTLIGSGTIIEGSIKSQESICVEGTVRGGKIVTEGNVMVSEKSRVDADIYAHTVVLSGEVNGNIIARSRLEITTKGKLRGDIRTGSLVIAEGVLFEGKCQMMTDERSLKAQAGLEDEDTHGDMPI